MSKIKGHVLVTGAGGFIGKTVVRKLIENNYQVRAMIRPHSVAPFTPHPKLAILWADILNYDSYANKVGNINVIVHLAANKYHPKLSYLVNIRGAENLVKLINEKRLNDTRLINISTQSTKIKWMGVYGKSKKKSDEIIESSSAKWTTIKPSLVYGPGEGTLFQTIVSYNKKLPIVPVVGNGKWELYPIDVEDVAKAIIKTIESNKTIGKVYDLGSSQKITFDGLIKLIQKEIGIKKPIFHIPFLPGLAAVYLATKIIPNLLISIDNVLGSNQNTHCNPKPAIRDLKFKPISIRQGIKKYLGQPRDKKARMAVVGLGKMGTLHSTVLTAIKGVKISALIDKKSDLGKTAQSMGIKANFYSSFEQALKKEKINAAYICTPTFAHFEIMQSCLRHNIPYFVEKPVFNNISQFKEILRPEFKRTNRLSAAGYFWIYRREIRETKKLLNRNEIGKIKRYKINLRHSEVFGKKKGWLFKRKLSGGGVLINPGPHAFSIIQYLFGAGKVQDSELKYIYGNEVEDEAKVTLVHLNGIKGILTASWSIPGFPVLTIEYEIVGEKGSIKFKNNKLTVKKDKKKPIVLEHFEIPSHFEVFNLNPKSGGDAYYAESASFVQGIRNEETMINNLNFAYKVESMISQAYEKAK